MVKLSIVSFGTKMGVGSAIAVAAAIVLCMLFLKGHIQWKHPDSSLPTHTQHKSVETPVTKHLEPGSVSPKELHPASYAAVDD